MIKNPINKIIIFFLFISIFLLIYTHYKSAFVYDSKRISFYVIYYIASSTGILFFSFILILNKTIKENIITSLITFILLAYISEGILIFLNKKNPKIDDIQMEKERRIKRANLIYKNYNIEVETKSSLEFKEHLDKQGVKVFLLVSPFRMLDTDGIKNFSWQDSSNQPKKIYPLSGKSHKLTLGGSETGKYIIYKSDRYGFNNSDDEWDKKIDITVIGDSNVHSNHLPREYGYAGRLKKLTNKSVINLGIGNNGPLIELATLKEYAKKLKPKLVLWVYCEDNDLPELKKEIKSKILSQYLKNGFSQNLIEKQSFIENNYDIFVEKRIKNRKSQVQSSAFSIEKNNNKYLSYIKLIEIRKILFNDLINSWRNRITKEDLLNFKKVLIEAKRVTDSFNGKFYFVYLPATTRYISDFDKTHLKKNDYYRDEVLKIAEDIDLTIIDLWKLHFQNLKDPLTTLNFRLHSHYNKETVEILTKKIVQIIEK